MDHDPRLVEFARKLRREITPTEKILWSALRGRRFAGYRFRRQHLVDPYIVDFYCATAALVIELDGETHLGNEVHDRTRQDFLESAGLKVLRFWNTQIFDDLEPVLQTIFRECEARATVAPRSQPPRRQAKRLPTVRSSNRLGDFPSPPSPLPNGERGEE
jgi:very-short-patch-repair endonuclease